MMTRDEVKEFLDRCQFAHNNGFSIAIPEAYAEELVALGAEMPEGSVGAAELLAMAEAVLSEQEAPKKETKPASKPKAEKGAEKARTEAAAAKAAEETKKAEEAAPAQVSEDPELKDEVVLEGKADVEPEMKKSSEDKPAKK